MDVKLVLRDGSLVRAPHIDRVDSNGWAVFKPVHIPPGSTVVGVQLTVDLEHPEHFEAEGTYTLRLRGIDVR